LRLTRASSPTPFGLWPCEGRGALGRVVCALSTGDYVAFALVGDFEHLSSIRKFELLFLGQFGQEGFHCRVGQAGHKLHLRRAQGIQVEGAAHPAVKYKGRLADAKTPAHRGQQAREGFVVSPVASQDFQMQRDALGSVATAKITCLRSER